MTHPLDHRTTTESARAVGLNRRSLLGLGGAVTLGALGLSGCGNDTSALQGGGGDTDAYDAIIKAGPVATDSDLSGNAWAKAIKDRGVLKTGGSDSGPLFSLRNPTNGDLTGFDAGLAQLLGRYITGGDDVQKLIELTVTTVDTRETLIENDTVDAVFATYSITTARAKKVAFAGPYYRSGTAIMVRSDDDEVSSLDDLAGKTISTQQGSTTPDVLADLAPEIKVQVFPDDAQCLQALKTKRVDAYIIDQSILISDASSDDSVKVVGEPFSDDYYGIGVTRSDADAKTFVNAWLKKIETDGTWAKLWQATVGTVVEGDAPQPPEIGSVEGS